MIRSQRAAMGTAKTAVGRAVRVRLPFGSWWMAEDDFCSHSILRDDFENAEWRCVERFLEPGMTVLDIGALLDSTKVGTTGRVIAFVYFFLPDCQRPPAAGVQRR